MISMMVVTKEKKMIRTKDELLTVLKTKLGDEMKDEDIAFIEDLTDTFDDFEKKTSDDTDWKAKYEANDKEWRKKYTDRFFEGSTASKEDFIKKEEPPVEQPESKVTFDDLFKEN